jgi:hypothetical protein
MTKKEATKKAKEIVDYLFGSGDTDQRIVSLVAMDEAGNNVFSWGRQEAIKTVTTLLTEER